LRELIVFLSDLNIQSSFHLNKQLELKEKIETNNATSNGVKIQRYTKKELTQKHARNEVKENTKNSQQHRVLDYLFEKRKEEKIEILISIMDLQPQKILVTL
jgi:GTP1/Obg family GTP-binding protein